MAKTTWMMRLLFFPLLVLFLVFLIAPLGFMLWQSFVQGTAITFDHYKAVWANPALGTAFFNSITVSLVSAMTTTMLAFIVSYTIHFTTIKRGLAKSIRFAIQLPMLLPTITYGFVLIYVFGNQGILTKLLGEPLFPIYGFNGLYIGYVLYTLPAAFLIISNAMSYIDQRFLIVSTLMHDKPWRQFYHTTLRPVIGPLGAAFILSFILSFTDYGIPASVGGTYDVIATLLYQTMLGSIPNFAQGAVIAVMMLIPAIIGGLLLQATERFQTSYRAASPLKAPASHVKSLLLRSVSGLIALCIVAIFAVIVMIPFVKAYPYQLTFTLEHVEEALAFGELTTVYLNSLLVAFASAFLGILIAFIAALMRVRTTLRFRRLFDQLAIFTNIIPGMVLGLSYLLLFNDSTLKGTFIIIILSNLIHFFTTPYTMMKNALEKLDPTWETTSSLLHDSWVQTITKIILPNMKTTLVSVFSYYFINAMVTVSGVIFLVNTDTSLLSTKIKELQHYAKFNDIFILSLIILCTNALMMGICQLIIMSQTRRKHIHATKKAHAITRNRESRTSISRL